MSLLEGPGGSSGLRLLPHSTASGVSGVTVSTPSATGVSFPLLLLGPPEVRASWILARLEDDLLILICIS